jgi:hypothetical protein
MLHDEEIGAVLLTDVVERADARVLESGNCARLALETLFRFRFRGEMRRKDFDCDGAAETGVFGPVDFSHSAGA